MKLATLSDGTPDGRLLVVSRDLSRAVDAGPIVPSLLQALCRWQEAEAADSFFMVLPMDTSAAEVKTDVRVTYDDRYFYL